MMNATYTPLQNQGKAKLAHDINRPERDFVNSSEFMNMADRRQQSFKDSNSLTSSHACFVGGTLVHTEKGLVPIEQIKIGDKILSRSEKDNGTNKEKIFNKATNVIKTENASVYVLDFERYIDSSLPMREKIRLGVELLNLPYYHISLLLTESHPFWTQNRGWVQAKDLTTDDIVISKDGHLYSPVLGRGYENDSSCLTPIFTTNIENKGFIPYYDEDAGKAYGYLIDLTTGKQDIQSTQYAPVLSKIFAKNQNWKQNLLDQTPAEHRDRAEFYGFRTGGWIDPDTITWAEGEGPLTMTVYNIEVADTHTYFVGEAGIWVHNCGGE